MKILTPTDILNKTIYYAQKNQTVLDIARIFATTPQFIILDNELKAEPQPQEPLVIKSYGRSIMVTCEYLQNLTPEKYSNLITKNKVDYLFVGQLIVE